MIVIHTYKRLYTRTLLLLGILALVFPAAMHAAAATNHVVNVDLKHWDHPTKSVLTNNRVILNQLKLVGGTYPLFTVTMPKNSLLQHASGLETFLRDMAKANGYWSLELVDGAMDMKVTADPTTRKVTKLAYTGMAEYFTGYLPLKTLTYAQAGLHPVPYADWSKHAVNAHIARLVSGQDAYRDADWAAGLEQANGYDSQSITVSGRFKGEIVDHLRIGSQLSEVTKVLGSPSYVKGTDRFYKTKSFYVGFRGTSKIEEAFVVRTPKQNPRSTLMKDLLYGLNKYNDVWNAVDSSKTLQAFFDTDHGFIHGGGAYASAEAGIWVEAFDNDSYIEVYNNYEGALYVPTGPSEFSVQFTDEDVVINHARDALDGYANLNERFAKEALVSPGGTYRLLYDWITSDSQYFTLRTSDNSRQDRTVGGQYGDYIWLTDHQFIAAYAFETGVDLFDAAATDPGDGRASILAQIQGLPKIAKDSYDELQLAPINASSFKLTIEDRSYVVTYSAGSGGKLAFRAKAATDAGR